jgi:hypothetical protein
VNTRQKACRIVCPSKTRRERLECRLAYKQCWDSRIVQDELDKDKAAKNLTNNKTEAR